MSFEDRAELFGDPTARLVAEAVWWFHENHHDWPFWEELAEGLMEWRGWDRAEAEEAILEALRREEIQPRVRAVYEFSYALADEMADSIARRYMDNQMKRQDREEMI